MTPDNAVDGQLLIDALADQRNRAQNDAAAAVARWVMSQKRCAELEVKVKELEAELSVQGVPQKVTDESKKRKEPTDARAH